MTQITITRIGAEKTINYTNKKTGQPDSFKKIGVQTNEYGERWLDLTFRGDCPVKVGQSYEGEVKEREYNGKTYYDFEMPRTGRASSGGMDDAGKAQLTRIERNVNAILNELKIARGGKSSLESTVPYPESSGPTGFDDPADDPFAGMPVVAM